jgi:hypothetical protein
MPVPPCDISRIEFCADQNIDLKTYLKLKQHNAAPEEYRVPGTKLDRITPASYRAWLTMSKQPGSKVAQILQDAVAARRRGLLSLKSPNHPMNLLKEYKALKAASKTA